MKKQDRVCVTLIDTYNNDGLEYKDYLEFCEDNDIEPADEDSMDYYDWLNDTTNMYIDDFFTNLVWSKIDYPVMITGDLGLWNGRPSIVPVRVDSSNYATHYTNFKGECVAYHKAHYEEPSIWKAIKKCVSGRSIDDFKVRYNDGVIEVDAMHHDGTNTFYIHKLSKKGLERAESFENRYEDYEPKDYWFSRIKYDEIF